jgi:hypothetical protein
MRDKPSVDQLEAHAMRLNRLTTWLLVLVISTVLPLCLCGLLVLLVLTGIIAEPETVIEQIVRFLFEN